MNQQKKEGIRDTASKVVGVSQINNKFLRVVFNVPGSAGCRFFADLQAALCFPMIAVVGLLLSHGDAEQFTPFVWIMAFYAYGLLYHRYHRIKRENRGERVHSWLIGRSSLGGDDERARHLWEPLCCFVGALAASLSGYGALCNYLLFGAVTLKVDALYIRRRDESLIESIEDAKIEGQMIQRRVRERDMSSRSNGR